jgi:Rrf2 family protein
MTITKKAEYAIVALVTMARRRKDGFVSSQEVAAEAGVPPNLIAQTVTELRRAGWVEAQRGPHGGVRLIGDPSGITLRQVVERIDGTLGLTRCLAGKGLCENSDSCQLRGIWAEAQGKMLEVLERVSIEDLAIAKRAH